MAKYQYVEVRNPGGTVIRRKRVLEAVHRVVRQTGLYRFAWTACGKVIDTERTALLTDGPACSKCEADRG